MRFGDLPGVHHPSPSGRPPERARRHGHRQRPAGGVAEREPDALVDQGGEGGAEPYGRGMAVVAGGGAGAGRGGPGQDLDLGQVLGRRRDAEQAQDGALGGQPAGPVLERPAGAGAQPFGGGVDVLDPHAVQQVLRPGEPGEGDHGAAPPAHAANSWPAGAACRVGHAQAARAGPAGQPGQHLAVAHLDGGPEGVHHGDGVGPADPAGELGDQRIP